MVKVWIHILSDAYWEGGALVVSLPALPRLGETVYLSEQTLENLLEKNIISPDIHTRKGLAFNDAFTVRDICYIEDEELPHIMLSID